MAQLVASKVTSTIVAGGFALRRDDLFLDGCGEQQRGVDVRTDVEVYDEGHRQEVELKTPRAEPVRGSALGVYGFFRLLIGLLHSAIYTQG